MLGGCRSHESICGGIDCALPLADAAGAVAGSAGAHAAIAGSSGASPGGTTSAGGEADGGTPSTADGAASGGAASDAGAAAVEVASAEGGHGPNDDGGAAGSGSQDDPACPSAQPNLLSSFENNRFDVCPPRDGFWAYSSHVDLPCPVVDVCSIENVGTAAHRHALAFEPPPSLAWQSLMLDLRRNGAPAPDAGKYTGIASVRWGLPPLPST